MTYLRHATTDTRTVFDHPAVKIPFYIVIFFIPLYHWRHIPPIPVDWLMVMFIGVVAGLNVAIRKRLPSERLRGHVNAVYLVFFVINVVAFLLSPYPGNALEGLKILLFSYVFIVLTQLVVSRNGFVTYLPAVLGVAVGVCSLLSIAGVFFDIKMFTQGLASGGVRRGAGVTIGANNMCIMIVFTLPLVTHWLLNARSSFSKLTAFCLIPVLIFGVISTYSRGGFIHLILTIALILFLHRRLFHPKYLGLVVALAGIGVLGIVLAAPKSYFSRQSTLAEGIQADSAIERRFSYLRVGSKAFMQRPFLGHGPYTFQEIWYHSPLSRRFEREKRYAHNTYLEVLVGTGVTGGVVFLCLLGIALKDYLKAKRCCELNGEKELASMTSAYMISFAVLLSYFMIHSALDHKMLLLGLALSQIALRLAPGKCDEAQTRVSGESDDGNRSVLV